MAQRESQNQVWEGVIGPQVGKAVNSSLGRDLAWGSPTSNLAPFPPLRPPRQSASALGSAAFSVRVSGERLPRAGRFPALQPVPRAFAATSPVSLGEVHGRGRQTSRAGRGPSHPPSSLHAHWVPGEGASSPPTGCERSETPVASLSLRMSPGSSLVHSAIHRAETHMELTGFQRTSRWHPAPGRVVRRTPLSHSTVSSSPGGGAAPQHGPSRSVPSQPWPRCFLGLGPPSSTFHANGVAQRVTSRRLAFVSVGVTQVAAPACPSL